MVFIVILSSVLLAVCTSLKPIYLQNAIAAVEAGDYLVAFASVFHALLISFRRV